MRRALAVATCSLLVLAGCTRKREYPPPERYVPATAPLAVVVPALGTAARQAGALYRTIALAPQAAPLADAHAAVKAQLGFDPLDPRGIEQAGVDPAGAAAAALGSATPPVLVLPVQDLPRLDATVARLARDRMGATQRVTVQVKGIEVVTFRRDGKGPASIAFASVGAHALLASGPDSPGAVADAATLPEEGSLWKSPVLVRAREALGPGWLAIAVAPPGSPALDDLRPARDGAALGLNAEAARLGLRAALFLTAAREEWWKSLAGGKSTDTSAASVLPPDSALVVRWAGQPAEAARRLEPWFPPAVRKALADRRLDPVDGLSPALAPGAVASLALAPTFTLTDFASPRFDARRVDPFSLVHLDAVLPVRDAAAVRAYLARLQKAGTRLGIQVVPRGPRSAPTGWTLSWGKARLGLALAGERLLVAGGPDRLGALEAREKGGYEPSTPAGKSALASGLGGAVLDVDHLARSVETLPDEAYGTGPNAVVMRSVVSKYLEPASALAAVSARVELVPGAVLLDLDVDGRSAPSPRP